MERPPRGRLIEAGVRPTLSGPAEIATLMVHGLPALPASAPSSTTHHIGWVVGAARGSVGGML